MQMSVFVQTAELKMYMIHKMQTKKLIYTKNKMTIKKIIRISRQMQIKAQTHISNNMRIKVQIHIGKHITAPAQVEIISQSDSTSVAQIKISEGKNRQVRRMFEAVGHRVVALERTAIGNMKMAHLRQGQYRKLSNNEIEYLKSL